MCHKSVPQECLTRVSQKNVKQECSAKVAFNAIQHLLFALLCSVGTLLLRELLKNAFGFVASIRFFKPMYRFIDFTVHEYNPIWRLHIIYNPIKKIHIVGRLHRMILDYDQNL